jgi:DNA primase
MFPIHDHRGRLIGFGGRVLDQGEPKYLNSPETPLFHKGRELYGLYRARDALKRTGRALVVEGYMDVVALAQFGLDYAVATLGTATTRDHLERLFRYVPEVVFCFDGDRAGREAAWRALENGLPVLHEGRQVSFLFLPEGEDPDTLVRKEGAAEFGARLKAATPLPDYLFQHLAAQVELNRLDGRARLVELVRPHLSKMRPGVLRQLMVARLAELSHLPVAELSRLLESGERPATLTAQRDNRRPVGGQARPSLVRTAIALLLQHPELARTVAEAGGEFRALEGRPGVGLLFDLLQLLRDRPDIKTGFIIEHYRDSEYQRALEKLLAWEHPTLSGDIQSEFQGVLDQLRREALGAETERLMDKDRLSGLTSAEKIELKRLLAEKSGGQPV